jgi:hypothetical protein
LFFSEFYKQDTFGEIFEAGVWVGIVNYRDKFDYNIAKYSYLCEFGMIECPIFRRTNYTTEVHLLIPEKENNKNYSNYSSETVI